MIPNVRPSLTPGHVIIPRVVIFEYVHRAIDWKRQQLADQGHPFPHLLRAFEPMPDCKVENDWAEPVVIGIWQTDERWACRLNIVTGALQLRKLPS